MAEILAEWSDFTGGHWLNAGPAHALKNQWGGVNITLTEQGALTAVCSSRWLQLSENNVGKVWGVFWGWGDDGAVYYLKQAGTSTTTSYVYHFTPNPSSLPNAVTTNTTFSFVPSYPPDWVSNREDIYFTVYGQTSYIISTATGGLAAISGNYGASPGGRCICIYKERIMVGGISDARFGNHPNRIHFAGDDTGFGGGNPNIADGSQWETLNYFDIAGVAGNLFVTAMYPLRDALVVVMEDQSVHMVTGLPNINLTQRKVYGFQKGTGAIRSYEYHHGFTDPSQTKVWMYDHTIRAPVRFNGASFTRVKGMGVTQGDRTGSALVEGTGANLGGPDEFIMHNVAFGRSAGVGVPNHRLEMVRVRGVWTIMQNDVIAARS